VTSLGYHWSVVTKRMSGLAVCWAMRWINMWEWIEAITSRDGQVRVRHPSCAHSDDTNARFHTSDEMTRASRACLARLASLEPLARLLRLTRSRDTPCDVVDSRSHGRFRTRVESGLENLDLPPTAVGDTEIELRACGLSLLSPISLTGIGSTIWR